MKNRFLLIAMLLTSLCSAQTTVRFRLNPSTGQDMSLGNNVAYLAPDSLSTEIGAVQWTCGGNACELTALFRYDLSSIPANAVVTDARLSLYSNPQQLNGNPALGPMYGSANACTLYPLLSAWSYSQTTWTLYPSYTSINAVSLPQSTTNHQDYLQLDVTASVMQMVSTPSQNFGWMLKMDGNSYYNSMIFCSGDYADTSKNPLLEITYEIPGCNDIRLSEFTGRDISYGNVPAYLAPDSLSTDLGTTQWTCGGTPCELRALLKFDLSAIPAGTNILSANLSLYANPSQQNGNPALGPMYGGSNSSELLQITSPWQYSSVSWQNQPAYTSTNAVTLSQSTTAFQDYLNLDVTAVVQDWINQPSTNFGWLMKIIGSSAYNSMIFCSGNHADSTKHPKLEICFETVGLSEPANTLHFDVYPNPAENNLTIQLQEAMSGVSRINIFDLTGKIIQSDQMATPAGKQIHVGLQSLSSGAYFIQLISDQGVSGVRRFIKIK